MYYKIHILNGMEWDAAQLAVLSMKTMCKKLSLSIYHHHDRIGPSARIRTKKVAKVL